MNAAKLSVWLGDNWPGPYVVTYELKSGRAGTVVVNGVTNPADALAVAEAQFPVSQDDFKGASIVTAKVAEASHHLGLLAERREARENPREAGRR